MTPSKVIFLSLPTCGVKFDAALRDSASVMDTDLRTNVEFDPLGFSIKISVVEDVPLKYNVCFPAVLTLSITFPETTPNLIGFVIEARSIVIAYSLPATKVGR